MSCRYIIYQIYHSYRCIGKKVALLVLRRVGLCFGQNQMCHLCGRLKLFLKKCGWQKNKKIGVGLSVCLLAVQLQYGLYVFGHSSKWFVFSFMFKFWSVVFGTVVLPLAITSLYALQTFVYPTDFGCICERLMLIFVSLNICRHLQILNSRDNCNNYLIS